MAVYRNNKSVAMVLMGDLSMRQVLFPRLPSEKIFYDVSP